jgi:hypothetical protein
MPLHGILNDLWGGADATVIEIDQGPVHREGLLDGVPEGFVSGNLGGGARRSSHALENLRERGRGERGG